jgi:hypothetical protein
MSNRLVKTTPAHCEGNERVLAVSSDNLSRRVPPYLVLSFNAPESGIMADCIPAFAQRK